MKHDGRPAFVVSMLPLLLLGCSEPQQRPGWPEGAMTPGPGPRVAWRDTPRPWLIGHRASGMLATEAVPENTIAGIKGTVTKGGAVGVEIDVALTLDGKAALMHDATLDRTTDCFGCVSQRTLAEIRACRVRPLRYLARPPSLVEALAALHELPVVPLLMIDVKADPWSDGCPVARPQAEHHAALGRAIGEALRDSGYAENVGVQSKHPALLAEVRRLAPEARLLIFDGRMEPAVPRAQAHDLDGVCVWADGIELSALDQARSRGMFVDTFVVNSPVDLAIAVDYQVDSIESDYVPEMLASFD